MPGEVVRPRPSGWRSAATHPCRLPQCREPVVPVGAGRNLSTGAIEVAGLIPKGARAPTFAITAAGTASGGFRAATRVGAPTYKASCLNWAAKGSSVANTALCNLDDTKEPGLIIW